jgi:thioredoxin 1
MGKAKTVTWASFEADVLKSEKPVLVDFWADWCGPCKSVAPIIDELAKEYRGRMVFAKVNVENNPQVATHLGIRSIPTMILFSKGEEKERMIGAFPKSHIQKRIDIYTDT